MTARFTALASGSAGNACLIQAEGCGVLLDFGLGPRTLAGRMAARGLSWKDVSIAILTHTHSDHWRETTLVQFARHRIRLYCHAEHAETLSGQSEGFNALHAARLVTIYDSGWPLDLAPGLSGIPLPVQHDAGATFGFRFEGSDSLFGPRWALGYAADLGCWDNPLVQALRDVDLLALEFNHDEELQRTSGRPQYLIDRVLGDEGHLSNRQAQKLLGKVFAESSGTRPVQIVTLHLSRECNRPDLAHEAARQALVEAESRGEIVIAAQHEPAPTLMVGSPHRVWAGRVSDGVSAPSTRNQRKPGAGNSAPPRVR
jgi:phosphoribosyl 1,2-cyclic phosphodiesterase